MKNQEKIFLKNSGIAYDRRLRRILNYNISVYDKAVAKGKERYLNLEETRELASAVKSEAVSNLPAYIEQFEKICKSRGTQVLWADNPASATRIIQQIISENNGRLIVKSKSMTSEEIGLNEFTEINGTETIETDLGEYIVQLAGEKPFHILTPAMHKSKEDVARLFHDRFGLSENSSPREIASWVRKKLRTVFSEADIGVTGANFIVADIGGIALTENEGNGLMTISCPKIHVVIAGIEKVIPSVRQLPFFYQWVGVHGTGQNISAYNSLILGPKNSSETDGPEKMFVILLDNGRSSLLKEKQESQALKCIRCGACLNACPVYKNIGGYTYSCTYTGPVGSVITPFYSGFSGYGHLSFACSLCGKCTEGCPVKIPLHDLLLLNRKRKVEKYGYPLIWQTGMRIYRFMFMKRRRLERIPGKTKNFITRSYPYLGRLKKVPECSEQSFSEKMRTLNP